MNIVLTGLRGSGKSKIAKLISEKLKLPLIDIDQEIEKSLNMQISKIVEKHGWDYFRKKEKEMTTKVAKLDNTVISTGGGTIINKKNEKKLRKNGKIIYLHRSPKICAKYIEECENRPALTQEESLEQEMKSLYDARNPRYTESADMIFERSEDLEKDTEAIVKQLKQEQ